MEQTSVKSYFDRGKYIFLYNIFERLTFFAFYVSIARYVDKDLYGLVISASAFTNIIASFFDLGFSFYIQRESATGNFTEKLLTNVFLLKTFLIILLLPFPIIYFLEENNFTIIILIALINFYYPVNQILVSYLNGKEKFKENFYSILISRIVLFILLAFFTIYKIDIRISLLTILFILFFQTNYLSRHLNDFRISNFRVDFNSRELLKIIRYSLPFGFGVIFTMSYDRLDVLILKYFSGNIDVAIYSVAYALYRHTSIFSTPILFQAYNKFSRSFNQGKEIKLISISKELNLLIIISVGLIIIFYLFGDEIIKLLYTEKFLDSYEYLKLISLAIPFIFLNNFTGILLNSQRLETITMYTTFIGLIINIVSNLILIPQLKIYGAVYSTIITETSIFLMQALLLLKFKNKKIV